MEMDKSVCSGSSLKKEDGTHWKKRRQEQGFFLNIAPCIEKQEGTLKVI